MTTTTEFQLVDINKLVPYANHAMIKRPAMRTADLFTPINFKFLLKSLYFRRKIAPGGIKTSKNRQNIDRWPLSRTKTGIQTPY